MYVVFAYNGIYVDEFGCFFNSELFFYVCGENEMRKKVFTILLTGSICMLSLAGCSGKVLNKVQVVEKGTQETVTLTFFGNKADESNVHVIEQIMSEFMTEHPDIVITYESIKGADYYETLMKRMETGNGDDIFMVDHDSTITLHKEGKLADLTGLSTIDRYMEDMKEQFIYEDGIYWLPTTVSAFGLYCNMDMLKEHNQTVPTNWKEFEAVCDYFVEKGITPVVANNDISLKTLAIGTSYYEQYQSGQAGQFFTDLNSGKIGFGESLSKGISLVDKMLQKKYVDADDTQNTQKTSDDLEDFAKGEYPFMLTGVWASDRLKSDYHAKFNYEVDPLPILEDGSLVVVNPDTRLAVNADSKYPDEAKLFVDYFTQTENLHAFCEDQCSISPLKDGESSSAKEIQQVIQCYQEGRIVIGGDYRLNLPIWHLAKNATQKLLDGISKTEVQKELDEEAEKYRLEND